MPAVQALLQSYDTLLKSTDLDAVWQEFYSQMQRLGLGRPASHFTRSLRPRLLPRRLGEKLLQQAKTLARAAVKCCQVVEKTPALLEAIGLTPLEQELARAPAPPGLGLTRIDGFLEGERFRVVEWNGGCPAGGAYLDRLALAFQALRPFQDFCQKHEALYIKTAPHVLENLLARYRAQGGSSEKPSIAIVDFAGLSTADEHEMFRELFAREGYRSWCLPPEALSFQNGVLLGPHGPIDIVYRRLVTRDYLPRLAEYPALAEAAKAGAATIVDPFRTEILHKKSFLALLSDPAYEHLFTPQEQEVIRQAIPWTRRFGAYRTTSPQGALVDLTEYALAQQKQLVLKPTDGYGGKGVLLGWEVDSALWHARLKEALEEGRFVLQERVATPRALYPVWEEGSIVWRELLEDLCPYLAEDEPHGFLCRATERSLGNVSAGAHPLPVFLVEGEVSPG